MRRVARILLVGLVSACAWVPLASGSAGAARWSANHLAARPDQSHFARILIYAQEWSLWTSRSSLPAGAVGVQIWNRGQDPHNLKIGPLLRGGRVGQPVAGASTTASGAITSARWHLRPGVYELYCSLPGHFAAGMHARLVVR